MQINDRMEQLHNAVSQTYTAVEPDGPGNCGKQERGRSREIVCEHFLDVYVDEQLAFRLTCTATHLPELILGRLFTEGWIESVRDVESITICESGRSARVFLQENLRGSGRQIATGREASCCIGNLTFLKKKRKKTVTGITRDRMAECVGICPGGRIRRRLRAAQTDRRNPQLLSRSKRQMRMPHGRYRKT